MTQMTGFRKWAPLAVMALALFIVVLDSTVLNVSLKAVIGDLHSNLKNIQWVITGYSLMLAAFTITGGRLGDIFGRKKMFIIGAVIFGVGSIMASRAQSDAFLMLSVSVVEGLGAAMMLPATASLLVSTYRGKDRAIAFGIYGAVAGAAASIGPLVGGWLTTNYSWRWNYLINPVIALIILAGSFLVHEAHERHPHRPDILSVILSALGLGLLTYGIIESSTYGWIRSKLDYEIFGQHYGLLGMSVTTYAVVLGAGLLVMFAWRQVRLEKSNRVPLVSTGLVKNRGFMMGATVTAVAVLGQLGWIFSLPILMQGLMGKDAFHTGLALLPASLAILVASPLAGVLAGKFNVPQRTLVKTGLILALIGIILQRVAVTPSVTEAGLIPGLVLFGLGFGLMISQLANITLSAVSVELAGEASGVSNTFRQIGTSLGQAIVGALLIAAIGTQLTGDVARSKVLPDVIKPQVTVSATASAESLGAGNSSAHGVGQLDPQIAQEIQRIKGDAVVHGVRTGFDATAAAIAVAFVMSFWLPQRAKHHT